MSFRASFLGSNRFLALDRGIRVFDNTLSDFGIHVVNRIRGPAVQILGTFEIDRVGKFALASFESRCKVLIDVFRGLFSLQIWYRVSELSLLIVRSLKIYPDDFPQALDII
jgi:hypothetical protein